MTIEQKWAELSDRDRDSWVAEVLMNRKREVPSLNSFGMPAPWNPKNYSTSLDAAWDIIDRFKSDFGKFGFSYQDKGICIFRCKDGSTDPKEDIVFAKTAPHAICLAALKIKGVKI